LGIFRVTGKFSPPKSTLNPPNPSSPYLCAPSKSSQLRHESDATIPDSVITNGNTPIARSTLINHIEANIWESEKTPKPGLNLGAMVMIDDFEQPLPYEF